MTLRTSSTFALATLAVCVVGRAAHAAPDRIAVEVYDGARPGDAAALLGPAYAELGRRGYAQGAPLIDAIGQRLSRDGGALTATQTLEAQKQVDDAYQRFIDGDYKRALAQAKAALDTYNAATGQLAREQALRDLRYKALIIAARSAEVTGASEEAFGTMAEAIRSFPDRPVNSAQFDPQVGALYRRVKDELAKQGAGALEVKVDDPSATIFVDERYVAAGTAKLDKLAPGRYRVYAARGNQPGRVHEIDVAPKGQASVTVPLDLDAALHTAEGAVVLDVDKGTDAEVQAATQLARGLGASQVVILSVRSVNNHRAIVGYAIQVESMSRTFAAVQVEPVAPSGATVGKLAALLAGDKSAEDAALITTEPHDVAATGGDGQEHGLGGKRTLALALGGVGVVALGAALGFELSSRSTYDESQREPDNARQKELYDSADRKYVIAQGLAIGGVACAAAAAIFWFTGAPADDEHAVALTPGPDGLSFTVSGRF